jgi:hypothetical protein
MPARLSVNPPPAGPQLCRASAGAGQQIRRYLARRGVDYAVTLNGAFKSERVPER